jgi:RNA polymerase sigma-70 factor (ECF subfamily)
LAELSAEDRETLTLFDLEGLTQEAYAQFKGLSLPGAKSRVQRARKRLRDRADEVGQGGPRFLKVDDWHGRYPLLCTSIPN